MTALAHHAIETDQQPPPPYLAGDRVQILYMSERGTVLADAHVTAVFRRPDGTFGVNAVMSDARASFHLVPATGDAPPRSPAVRASGSAWITSRPVSNPWPPQTREPQAVALSATTQLFELIALWLRDPEWGVGMLEDIAEAVKATGRDLTGDGQPSWGRH